MNNFTLIFAICLYQLVAIYDPRHSITFVIDYVRQSVCGLFYASKKRESSFFYWLLVAIATTAFADCCCCWLMRSTLFVSFDLIQMMEKNPTINEACIRSFVQHSVVWLLNAKAAIKHYADENYLFSTIYLSMANTSIHSAENYTHRMSYALKLYPNGWFRIPGIKKMIKHKTIIHISILVLYVVRNGDSLLPCALCHSKNGPGTTIYRAHVFCISIQIEILSILTFGV